MTPFSLTPCRCWSCRTELGKTDGVVLYLSTLVHVRRPLTLWCVCGGATFWKPVRRRDLTINCRNSRHY